MLRSIQVSDDIYCMENIDLHLHNECNVNDHLLEGGDVKKDAVFYLTFMKVMLLGMNALYCLLYCQCFLIPTQGMRH